MATLPDLVKLHEYNVNNPVVVTDELLQELLIQLKSSNELGVQFNCLDKIFSGTDLEVLKTISDDLREYTPVLLLLKGINTMNWNNGASITELGSLYMDALEFNL